MQDLRGNQWTHSHNLTGIEWNQEIPRRNEIRELKGGCPIDSCGLANTDSSIIGNTDNKATPETTKEIQGSLWIFLLALKGFFSVSFSYIQDMDILYSPHIQSLCIVRTQILPIKTLAAWPGYTPAGLQFCFDLMDKPPDLLAEGLTASRFQSQLVKDRVCSGTWNADWR